MGNESVKLHPEWFQLLEDQFNKPYFKELIQFVKSEYATKKVYPPGKQIFRALDLCPPSGVKVVILGQDPYHGPGQANGLCFSVNDGVAHPPSLQNIFKELSADLNSSRRASGDLGDWASQGVLLLNATLTVTEGLAGSHQGKGWEIFTDELIKRLAAQKKQLVFMLWGSYAQQKAVLIDRTEHLVLETTHPSPLSAHRGFIGSRHFSKANSYLAHQGFAPIQWNKSTK